MKKKEPEKSKKIRLVPLGTRCLVRRYTEQLTPGGLVIPKDAEDASLRGTVLAVGDGCDYVQEGDEVFFGRYSGREITHDLDTHNSADFQGVVVMVEDDILCKVEARV